MTLDEHSAELASEYGIKIKSFCYLVIYGLKNGISSSKFVLDDNWPFQEWFPWFCNKALELLQVDSAKLSLVFRALIACFISDYISEIAIHYTQNVLRMLASDLPIKSAITLKGDLFDYETLSCKNEMILYPAFLRFFGRAYKAWTLGLL